MCRRMARPRRARQPPASHRCNSASRYFIRNRAFVQLCYSIGMIVITIPRKLASRDDLVVIPRKEYESLKARVVPEVRMTASEKKALARARKAFKEGKLLSLDAFKQEMGRPRRAG